MNYRRYGKTDKELSMIGFGGMRFDDPADRDGCAATVLRAFDAGINYFDTAPGYAAGKSEEAIGAAVPEMKTSGRPFYISTKSSKPNGDDLRRDLEDSMKRLNVDVIDFFHCWYVLTMEDWERRKAGGAVEAILKAKEEGLIRHAAWSTHLPGHEIKRVIEEGYFEGVTLGYSAINFPYRDDGIQAAYDNGLGVVVMNPLGGGLIPNNPDTFGIIKARENQSILEAALHFLFSDTRITTPIVGFRNPRDVDTAVATIDSFVPYTEEEINGIRRRIKYDYNDLCTTCMYCKDCPEDIPVWKFMETANLLLLQEKGHLTGRLKYHWGADINELERCIQCGRCEEACTQQLPIMQRFEELKQAIAAENA